MKSWHDAWQAFLLISKRRLQIIFSVVFKALESEVDTLIGKIPPCWTVQWSFRGIAQNAASALMRRMCKRERELPADVVHFVALIGGQKQGAPLIDRRVENGDCCK